MNDRVVSALAAHAPPVWPLGPRSMTVAATYAVSFQLPHNKYSEKGKSALERFLRKIDIFTNFMYIYCIPAKLMIFPRDIHVLRKSCLKTNLENFFP